MKTNKSYHDAKPALSVNEVNFKALPHGTITKARKLFEEIELWKQPSLRCQIVLLRDSKDFSNLFDESQIPFSKIGQFFYLETNQTSSLYSRQKKQDKKKEKSKPGRPTTLTQEEEYSLFKHIIQCNNEKKPVTASEIVNYVFEVFGKDTSVSWVSSLVKRHADKIETVEAFPIKLPYGLSEKQKKDFIKKRKLEEDQNQPKSNTSNKKIKKTK